MTSRTWEDLVKEGVRLGQADPLDRWALGDVCVEAIPSGTDRTSRSQAQRQLEDFAAQTALPLGLLKDCYRTSKAWPPGTRFLDISHAKHSHVAAKRNRVDLLLNEDLGDGLPARVREKIDKVEELLADPTVREAVLDRSKKRTRRVIAAAKAIEDEEQVRARTNLRIQEQNAKAAAAAPEILARMAERAIKGNLVLARMIVDLLDLRTAVDQLPPSYHERTIEHLEQIQKAAQRVLDELRPEPRSPQSSQVIDMEID